MVRAQNPHQLCAEPAVFLRSVIVVTKRLTMCVSTTIFFIRPACSVASPSRFMSEPTNCELKKFSIILAAFAPLPLDRSVITFDSMSTV